MYSALSLRFVVDRGIQRSRNVLIIIIYVVGTVTQLTSTNVPSPPPPITKTNIMHKFMIL